MAVNIELEDVTPKSFRLAGVRSFDVSVNNSPFCSLVKTRKNYVLAWNGKVDFPTLEDEVLERLRLSIPIVIFGDQAIKEAAKVSVLTNQAALMEFYLRNGDDDFALQRWLNNPNDYGGIRFIRVDIGRPDDLLDYSFSTENIPNPSTNELSVRIPRRMPINGSLIDWVIKHYHNPPRLEGGAYLISDALNKAH